MYKHQIITVFLSLFSTFCCAQEIETILALNPEQVELRSPVTDEREFFIQTPFAKPLIVAESDLEALRNATVTKIELVYTGFSSVANFDQNSLNEKRLLALKEKLPKLFSDYTITWKLIEQTGCNSPVSCDSLFHGFIITARPEYTEETTAAEIDFIKSIIPASDGSSELLTAMVGEPVIIELTPSPGPPKKLDPIDPPVPDSKGFTHAYYPTGFRGLVDRLNYYTGRPTKKDPEEVYNVRLSVDPKGQVQAVELRLESGKGKSATALQKELRGSKWKPARSGSKRVADYVEMKLIVNHAGVRMEVEGMRVEPKSKSTLTSRPLSDSTLFKVFDRHADWNDIAIVGDLTGSMAPYTAQILLWHKLNLEAQEARTKHFTFFNDGDRTPNRQKKTGSVGGLYHSIGDSFDDIEKLAIECMRGGNGGDTEENNIEALLSAMNNCPECKEFVMIADNYAKPRDMKLIDQVDKPVRIIVCGNSKNINPAYLKLARKTGGSVHTLEADLENLTQLSEGAKFMFQGVYYQILRGELVPLSRM